MIGLAANRSFTAIPARALAVKVLKKLPSGLTPDKTLIRQAFLVLVFCAIIDLFPGYFLGRWEHFLERIPGLLIILPATVGLRGNIFGALAARLGSKLHLGTIEPRFHRNPELRTQLIAAVVQLLFLSLLIPVITEVVGSMLGLEVADAHILIFISIAAAVISGVLMFIITFGITFLAFKKGWDPDNVSTPIVASAGDILTIPVLFFGAFLALEFSSLVIALVSISAGCGIILLSGYLAFRGRGEAREILRQAVPVAMFAVLISTFSGLVLGASFDTLLKGSVFLLMVPAFNGQGGSMGSVLGSRVTSAAYLGQYRMSLKPNDLALSSSISLWLISLLVFAVLGGGGAILGFLTGSDIPSFLQMFIILLLGATAITFITSTVAYYIALLSFKLGLDPDNVVIPVLTASMDVVGTGSLIIVLLAMGVFF
ncbi:MAG: magnesium transporter [Thermoplasmatota archaeon]